MSLTQETLNTLYERSIKMHDDLVLSSVDSLQSRGDLADPELSKKAIEYENLMLNIEKLEQQLHSSCSKNRGEADGV